MAKGTYCTGAFNAATNSIKIPGIHRALHRLFAAE